ncbi:MAG: two pore domain potassium channel family protein, partial [Actinomycetota bacterium]
MTTDARPHPAVLDDVRHAIGQLVERATGEAPNTDPRPAPTLGALRDAGIPTVDDDTFQQRVDDLIEHRR